MINSDVTYAQRACLGYDETNGGYRASGAGSLGYAWFAVKTTTGLHPIEQIL